MGSEMCIRDRFLGPQARGDCVIRPSSKGPDHLAVTWKVHEGVYQHIDVLELDKENEFSVGKVLKVGGKWSYSDLDELIVLHVKAMAKKVEEMMGDDRYQSGSKQQTGKQPSFLSPNPTHTNSNMIANLSSIQNNGSPPTRKPTPSEVCTPSA